MIKGRFLFGIVLLLALLVLGLWCGSAMTQIHTPVSETLDRASQAALAGDLTAGVQLLQQARQQWEDHWHTVAAVADHEPMEEIDSLFDQVQVYGQAEEAHAFAACCGRLSRMVEAISDAHELNWWNLL